MFFKKLERIEEYVRGVAGKDEHKGHDYLGIVLDSLFILRVGIENDTESLKLRHKIELLNFIGYSQKIVSPQIQLKPALSTYPLASKLSNVTRKFAKNILHNTLSNLSTGGDLI